MRARATIAGHPIHQIMIPLPLGALIVGTIFDGIVALGGPSELSIAAFWTTAAGVVFGLLAALFGIIDWTAIPKGTRARAIGLVHAAVNVGALSLYATAVALRFDAPLYTATPWVLGLELSGFALAGLGGYFGGELVVRHGIGVFEDASPEATPSQTSSHRSAEDRTPTSFRAPKERYP